MPLRLASRKVQIGLLAGGLAGFGAVIQHVVPPPACPYEEGCVSAEVMAQVEEVKRQVPPMGNIYTAVPKATYVLNLYGQAGTYNIPPSIHMLQVTDISQVYTKCAYMALVPGQVDVEVTWTAIDSEGFILFNLQRPRIGYCIFTQR